MLGMVCGAAFIVVYLLTLFEPDPSVPWTDCQS